MLVALAGQVISRSSAASGHLTSSLVTPSLVGAATDQLCVNYGYNVYVCVGEEADDSVEERRGGTAGHTHSPRHLPEES